MTTLRDSARRPWRQHRVARRRNHRRHDRCIARDERLGQAGILLFVAAAFVVIGAIAMMIGIGNDVQKGIAPALG